MLCYALPESHSFQFISLRSKPIHCIIEFLHGSLVCRERNVTTVPGTCRKGCGRKRSIERVCGGRDMRVCMGKIR